MLQRELNLIKGTINFSALCTTPESCFEGLEVLKLSVEGKEQYRLVDCLAYKLNCLDEICMLLLEA